MAVLLLQFVSNLKLLWNYEQLKYHKCLQPRADKWGSHSEPEYEFYIWHCLKFKEISKEEKTKLSSVITLKNFNYLPYIVI